jgi:predicted TIM-barrel fold metal-dependent hydrolase
MIADLDIPPVPMGINLGINPHKIDEESLERIEQKIVTDKKRTFDFETGTSITKPPPHTFISGFKIYAGYYHVDINDEVYMPIYKIAAEHNLAVAIHGGETYFKEGLLEYSRPIHVDKLAYNYNDLKIIICHMGFPWVMEACEIATKNKNVYIDISGLAVGGIKECELMRNEPLIRDYFRQGLVFLNNYKKVIFGTDWPLVAIGPYIEACKSLIPYKAWEDVFYNNALSVYTILPSTGE